MSKWLALAEHGEGISNSLPDNRLKPAESPFCRFLPPVGAEEIESSPPSKPGNRQVVDPKNHPRITQRSESESSHGISPGGRPLTYTGKVVSLDAWRQLSEWEKHGPNGKHWNGLSRQWEGSD